MYDELIEKIKPYIKKYEAYLVGGYIRDMLLGKTSKDRDIAINCDCLKELCIKIADEFEGSFVELDSENEIYRVVFKEDYIDFAKMENLEDDINRRDFTINSIMYDIARDKILDKNGGMADFRAGLIRTYSINNMKDDPLRMLRAFRFQSSLGFKIAPEILDFISSNGMLIKNIAKERINTELIKIFEGNSVVEALQNMDNTGFLEIIFPVFADIKKIPSNSHHHLDLFHHLLETVRNITINKPELRLAAFLHDIAKPDTWKIEPDTGRHRFIGHDELGGRKVIPILKELKFSNKQIEYISKMIANHIYPSALMADPNVSEKAIIRFLTKIGEDTPDLINLARADRLSALGVLVTKKMVQDNLSNLEKLLRKYYEFLPKMKELPKLIDGHKIMEITGFPPSPILRKIIDEIKELQLEGKINSKDEAENYVKRVYQKGEG